MLLQESDYVVLHFQVTGGDQWTSPQNPVGMYCDLAVDNGVDVVLPPEEFSNLAKAVGDKINSAAEQGRYPGVITSARRRRFIHTVLQSKGIRNPVLSFEELGTAAKPSLVGMA